MSSDETVYHCADLPTRPDQSIGTVLVAGAGGYIGGRLVPELLHRGYRVRIMVRAASPEHQERWPDAELVEADALDLMAVLQAMEGVHTAYYLIHSMLIGMHKFEDIDIRAARNFRTAAAQCGVRRLIYLGGLGDTNTTLSPHLASRAQVAQEFRRGSVPTTILRAAIILGSGSASYEMINHLVRRLPVIPVPKWAKTKCQPIGLRDVIKSLVGVMELPEAANRTFDIGSPDIMTYEEIIGTHAEVLGKTRRFIPSPISNIRLYSYIASLLTPVPASITWCLMESVTHDVVCLENDILELLPFRRISCREALVLALSREEQDAVHTRWSDSYPPDYELAIKLRELTGKPTYTSSYSLITDKAAASLFSSITHIGGKKGWFHSTFLWRIRGGMDRLLRGVGTTRGRRSEATLRVNDVVDFWRVEKIEHGRTLLLRSEMKLPGYAWLEFRIEPVSDTRNELSVTAYYKTSGLWGHTYWYIFLPFHHFIFNNLIKQIEQRSV